MAGVRSHRGRLLRLHGSRHAPSDRSAVAVGDTADVGGVRDRSLLHARRGIPLLSYRNAPVAVPGPHSARPFRHDLLSLGLCRCCQYTGLRLAGEAPVPTHAPRLFRLHALCSAVDRSVLHSDRGEGHLRGGRSAGGRHGLRQG